MKSFFRLGLLMVVMFIVAGELCAQNMSSVIKTQAMEMARALVRKDYPAFARYMHPQVMDLAGGRDKLIRKMDTAHAIAEKFGAEIRRILIGNPGEIIKYNKELQAVLPQTTEMKTGLGSLAVETSLVAISPDAGKHWYFIDTSAFEWSDLKKSLPNLSPQLVIPPAKTPKFTPNQ